MGKQELMFNVSSADRSALPCGWEETHLLQAAGLSMPRGCQLNEFIPDNAVNSFSGDFLGVCL